MFVCLLSRVAQVSWNPVLLCRPDDLSELSMNQLWCIWVGLPLSSRSTFILIRTQRGYARYSLEGSKGSVEPILEAFARLYYVLWKKAQPFKKVNSLLLLLENSMTRVTYSYECVCCTKTWVKEKHNLAITKNKSVSSKTFHQLCFLGTAGYPGECGSLKGPVLCVHAGNQATTVWLLKKEAPSPRVRNKEQWLRLSSKLEWHVVKGCQVRRCSPPADKERKSPVLSRWCVCRKESQSHYLPLQSLKDIWARLWPFCSSVPWVGSPASQCLWHMGENEATRWTMGMTLWDVM